ncbi:hypothetical protein CORC01_07774 [Colletotrichum orchidophilum]|uniref:BZIP domain-containing protein n=1 Tax=Colletotrichum orchidophilum TaxID=1209926 RepID=A0A1G4B6B2_9PEZI|nr:uncharacterized protein CORC01_07774 [Colletotrichum orchidophilum]OHE96989.1 hypothetical protein CORC01_07774 [Colletotrichum orchidophilum]
MADKQVRLQDEASVRAGEGESQHHRNSQHQGQQRQQYDRSSSGDNRIGFVEYWREEKESERAGRVQFVNEGPPRHQSSSSPLERESQPSGGGDEERQGSSESTTPGLTPAEKAKEKAKLRRQQVRKAQIQHRTRKANYIKQLELDVCKFRNMIAAAEKEVLAFRRENGGMRVALTARGLQVPEETKVKDVVIVDELQIRASLEPEAVAERQEVSMAPAVVQQQQGLPPVTAQPQHSQQSEQQAQFSAAPPDPQMLYQPQTLDYDPYPPVDLFADVNMGEVTVTMRKDDALGTPCFQISSPSAAIAYTQSQPPAPDQLSAEQEIIAINLILAMEHICWNHFHPRQFPSHGDACKAASGHTMMASTMCMSSAPARVYRTIRRGEAETVSHTWQADTGAGSALSLKSLLALAKTLNPGDIELTPVQAWFELAARYGAAALMRDSVIEALKREFCGVVDCIHFGAIIERDAFESVVARVMEQVGVPELEWEMDVDEGAAGPAGMVYNAQQITA